MPFIKPERRHSINSMGFVRCVDRGDLCYVFYKKMVEIWKKEPRWTTAHTIYKEFVLGTEDNALYWAIWGTIPYRFGRLDLKVAADLAWQVFFQKFVMPYEAEKEAENGGIE